MAESKPKAPRVHRLGTFELKGAEVSTVQQIKRSSALDDYLSTVFLLAIQVFVMVVVGAGGFHCAHHVSAIEYGFFRDVNIMIFFGFGFLMTFLHRHGLSAIGYCLITCCVVAELSLVFEYFINQPDHTGTKYEVTIETLMNSLFCGGTVMISYGAVIGKVTPTQLLVMAFVEVICFWINFRICVTEIGAHDVGGGMVIHSFGAYFGLAATWWVTKAKAIENPEEKSIYSSDIFSLAGSIFLWCLWPSFQAAVAGPQQRQFLAICNTFISLCSSCIAFAAVSRLLNRHKFDVVHLQNATLAGGVVMGVAGDMDMGFYGPMIAGFCAGALSCVGYSKVMPLLVRLNIHDTCGVNNLHGMPGILSGLVGVFATLRHGNGEATLDLEGNDIGVGGFGVGAEKQIFALLVTLGVAIVTGFGTGFLMTKPLELLGVGVADSEFYNDRLFFGVSSDYADSAVEKDVDAVDASSGNAPSEQVVCSV